MATITVSLTSNALSGSRTLTFGSEADAANFVTQVQAYYGALTPAAGLIAWVNDWAQKTKTLVQYQQQQTAQQQQVSSVGQISLG